APLFVKYSSKVAEVVDSLQPAFVERGLQRYREWLEWLGELYSSNLSEATLRTAGMTAVELFLLIGILGFSEPIADSTGEFLTRANVAFAWWQPAYWAIISLIGLILIVVIVRGMVSLC